MEGKILIWEDGVFRYEYSNCFEQIRHVLKRKPNGLFPYLEVKFQFKRIVDADFYSRVLIVELGLEEYGRIYYSQRKQCYRREVGLELQNFSGDQITLYLSIDVSE